jgi:hypothetical protein
MAQSTTTLLKAANEVLLDIGERPILNFGGNLGLKLKSAMTSAVYDVGLLDDWSWLQDRRNADAWAGNTAILNNRRRLYKVQYRPEAGSPYLDVKYITPADFDRQTHLAYNTIGTYPLYYTTGPELSVFLNPYPTTEDERVKLWFTAVDTVVPPTNNTDTFPVPERFVQLIKKRALYYMSLRHLDDIQAASMFNNEYEIMAQRLRDTERSHTVGILNMYRRR